MLKRTCFSSLIIFGIIILFLLNFFINHKKSPKLVEPNRIPILLYHDIVKIQKIDKYNFHYGTTIASFEENLKTILANGYKIITISDLYNSDKRPINSIIINFDDGLISNYELVFPILKKYNIKVGMAITADLIGTFDYIKGRSYFTWAQAKEMDASGLVEFYSLGKKHIFSRNVSLMKLKKSTIKSISTINHKLKVNDELNTYSQGSDDKLVFIPLTYPNSYTFIKRVGIPYNMSGEEIIYYIENYLNGSIQ